MQRVESITKQVVAPAKEEERPYKTANSPSQTTECSHSAVDSISSGTASNKAPSPIECNPVVAFSTFPPAAAELLTKLKDGNQRYISGNFKPKGSGELRRRLSEFGQQPEFAILGCADSRVTPEQVFDMDAGELFDVRVAGNVVTPEGAASLEYSVAHCKVKLIFVLGHTKCGAVAAAASGAQFTGHIPFLVQRIKPACSHKDPVKKNVQLQMESLRENFAAFKDVFVSGGIFDITTGEVEFLDVL